MSILSDLTGIHLGNIGAPIGAAIGSIIPGVGTAVGASIGQGLGSFGSGGGGGAPAGGAGGSPADDGGWMDWLKKNGIPLASAIGGGVSNYEQNKVAAGGIAEKAREFDLENALARSKDAREQAMFARTQSSDQATNPFKQQVLQALLGHLAPQQGAPAQPAPPQRQIAPIGLPRHIMATTMPPVTGHMMPTTGGSGTTQLQMLLRSLSGGRPL